MITSEFGNGRVIADISALEAKQARQQTLIDVVLPRLLGDHGSCGGMKMKLEYPIDLSWYLGISISPHICLAYKFRVMTHFSRLLSGGHARRKFKWRKFKWAFRLVLHKGASAYRAASVEVLVEGFHGTPSEAKHVLKVRLGNNQFLRGGESDVWVWEYDKSKALAPEMCVPPSIQPCLVLTGTRV